MTSPLQSIFAGVTLLVIAVFLVRHDSRSKGATWENETKWVQPPNLMDIDKPASAQATKSKAKSTKNLITVSEDYLAVRPRLRALQSVMEVQSLVAAGITHDRLRELLRTIPIVRVGPGYVLFLLSDGSLRIDLVKDQGEMVQNYEFFENNGEKIEVEYFLVPKG